MEQSLHDQDYNLWLEQTAIALRSKDIERMDWENLVAEIEDMGASQKRALRSYMYRLIEHIFKLQYWEQERERNRNNWRIEVANFRNEINSILEDSPSLKNYLSDNYLEWYKKSLKKLDKSGVFAIPKHQTIDLLTILNDDFFG